MFGRLRVEKQLICLRCGDVIGDVVFRPLAWTLRITAPDGRELGPQTGAVHERLAEQQVASASSPSEVAEATSRAPSGRLDAMDAERQQLLMRDPAPTTE